MRHSSCPGILLLAYIIRAELLGPPGSLDTARDGLEDRGDVRSGVLGALRQLSREDRRSECRMVVFSSRPS